MIIIMQLENTSLDVSIADLKRMLDGATLENIKIVSGQIIDKPVVAKSISISGGNIKSMILARTINIADSDAVIEKGGTLVCARIFHDLSHSVNGGVVLAGKEFYKLGRVCCNYTFGNSCEELMILGEV